MIVTGTSVMIVSFVMMLPLPRSRISVQPAPGDELREAFKAPTMERTPERMLVLTRQITGPLRLIKGGRQS